MVASTEPAVLPTATPRVTAVLLAIAGVLLVLQARTVRVVEAWLQVGLLRTLGQSAEQVGAAVLVTVHGERVGIALTLGCSVGPLLAFFLIAVAPLIWYRDIPQRRVLTSVALLVLVLTAANQVRIAVIVFSMRLWGIERGYDLSHVFFGSAITTVGFVVGVVIFFRMFTARGGGRR